MGCRIIANNDYAVFYCSTSMIAFGPVMFSEAEALEFMDSLDLDPREYDEQQLLSEYSKFMRNRD